ncbi:MAG TPA: hypothetical protein PLS03_13875 [Terrimicrobiaceae bacterium]|nr:hypothetical protein [Terrimicrobiaceae bacterium]
MKRDHRKNLPSPSPAEVQVFDLDETMPYRTVPDAVEGARPMRFWHEDQVGLLVFACAAQTTHREMARFDQREQNRFHAGPSFRQSNRLLGEGIRIAEPMQNRPIKRMNRRLWIPFIALHMLCRFLQDELPEESENPHGR